MKNKGCIDPLAASAAGVCARREKEQLCFVLGQRTILHFQRALVVQGGKEEKDSMWSVPAVSWPRTNWPGCGVTPQMTSHICRGRERGWGT